jgi:hypothetical protein
VGDRGVQVLEGAVGQQRLVALPQLGRQDPQAGRGVGAAHHHRRAVEPVGGQVGVAGGEGGVTLGVGRRRGGQPRQQRGGQQQVEEGSAHRTSWHSVGSGAS